MRTRIIALVVAAVLAIVGGVVLVNYVRQSDARAFAGAQLTEVLMVTRPIPAGTLAASLTDSVEVKSVPVAFVAEGAVTNVVTLSGLIAAVDLQPGEQVLASRFVKADEFGKVAGSIVVPDGLQEVSIAVDAQRVVGGRIAAGDTIGLFVSLSAEGDEPSSTRLLLNKVLVTSVAAAEGVAEGGTTAGLVLVGLAVSADDAQKVVYSAEFGRLWLSKQGTTAKAPKSSAVERDRISG